MLRDSEDDPDGNVQHIAEHGLEIEDVEWVLGASESEGRSNSSRLPAVWGYTPAGVYIIVVYQEIEEDTIRVVTRVRSSGTTLVKKHGTKKVSTGYSR